MKYAILLAALLSAPVLADTQVQGYTKSDGSYVAPYTRTSPDTTTTNNYSAPGNYNPYTGQQSQQSGSSGHSGQYQQNHSRDSSLKR